MNKPIRTTLVFALASGLLFGPLTWTLSRYWFWPPAVNLVLWAELAIYALLLARWSHTRVKTLLFPLVLLLAMALWPGMYGSFILLALVMFSWIRSGICFQGTLLRNLMAELVTVVGGLLLVVFLTGASAASWSLGMCLFGLVQSLYFFMVSNAAMEETQHLPQDPFEHAFQEAEKILVSD
jgi:hypothetical protein